MLFVAAIRSTQAVWRSDNCTPPVGSNPVYTPCVPTPTAAACFSFAAVQKLNPSELCSQASLAQRLCSAAERGSVSQLSLYTSPSLPNITLGLPATATATAASNVRSAIRQPVHPFV